LGALGVRARGGEGARGLTGMRGGEGGRKGGGSTKEMGRGPSWEANTASGRGPWVFKSERAGIVALTNIKFRTTSLSISVEFVRK
jgi:hypothetical protein